MRAAQTRAASSGEPLVQRAIAPRKGWMLPTSVVTASALAMALLSPLQAHAWGSEGHRLVASLAAGRLTPAARSVVATLLQLSDLEAVEEGLEEISTWADEVRSPSTAPWHYVNFRLSDTDSGQSKAGADEGALDGAPIAPHCAYEASRHCIDGLCVVAAIGRHASVVRNQRLPAADRAKALRYLVHLVEDVHQPLHSGFAEDRGGNSYQVQAFGRGSNLHRVWDTVLIGAWPGGVGALRDAVSSAVPPSSKAADPAAWSGQACTIVSSTGFYPQGRQVGHDYLDRWAPTLTTQWPCPCPT